PGGQLLKRNDSFHKPVLLALCECEAVVDGVEAEAMRHERLHVELAVLHQTDANAYALDVDVRIPGVPVDDLECHPIPVSPVDLAEAAEVESEHLELPFHPHESGYEVERRLHTSCFDANVHAPAAGQRFHGFLDVVTRWVEGVGCPEPACEVEHLIPLV